MYVKLISKPNEWFDAGTEVFEAYMDGHNAKNKPFKRMSGDEYKIWEKSGNMKNRQLLMNFSQMLG